MRNLIIIVFILILGINTYAEILQDGLYSTDDKCIEIKIKDGSYLIENYYTFEDKKVIKQGKLIEDENGIIFDGLKSIFYYDENYGEEAYNVFAEITENKSFKIQNYGNSMNPYIVFSQCGEEKFLYFLLIENDLDYIKDEIFNNTNLFIQNTSLTINQLLENSKINQKILIENIKEILKNEPLNTKTLTQYNDIAYYLQQADANEEAIFLLEKIIEKYPNRIVAYLNLADSYNGINNKEKAKENYNKYISLMKQDNKEDKIPKRVLEFLEKVGTNR